MDGNGIAGRVALVTGAGRGIGAAVVRALVEAGAVVAAVDRDAEGVTDLAGQLSGEGHRVAPFVADVRDGAAVESVVDRVERELGPVAILANVAGVLRTGPVVSMSDEDWAETFAVNTTGVFHVSRAVARRMAPRRSGVIVTVSSNAAGVPRMRMGAYAASKAASTMFTKCLGLELAEFGIRCNVVAPGSTDTPMQRAMWADGSSGAESVLAGDPAAFRVGIPLGRMAEPSDVADAVVFLASDRARHITMHDLYVDGGATLRA
ncbi:2,3-dihydro-2,3-dihydroxybenzoate dehydrogenase [Streptoalloteichus tenebrarius]|uniref:2,3-dihydro-2,3-dihydroxybenzoate dehydrogenase n=1 Tax=Streptoalloteichus tenebrarius (strain ATCC 17920 / DSM 40477 / JCM 4838 / CBS 697.72 / NBRC 16177 / NCIMB 11028 / NRRL B-12390 / A12253. 1 / ISP 5477) TaxID=1933 RepID=A0ABT1I0B2_STRSD|nr:2,3-dihydro-2,3-dihydroxybenzoate dehydrogenase [Streptoalloteichus tenebrarius]MCP2261205.1 2,3-dihydro-2,3-dihydroxybenzoate dehydrogenase [Streptoalloteichus tenebrarius]BFF02933.1 2,3-dihydro-2,3-dihydroxybenzoate dehydrogenase [Streptoalloteichus tenebrarius]